MTRRDFIGAAALATGGVAAAAATADTEVGPDGGCDKRVPPAPRNRRPYAGIDWANALQIKGTTHVHCTSQDDLDAILKRGIRFLTLSNYYPSAPWYPLANMTRNYWRLHHDFPVVVHGKRTEGPFDWNAMVGQWVADLPEPQRAQYPFTEGEPLFRPLPDGVLEAPNAEHHAFLKADGKAERRMLGSGPSGNFLAKLHINAPGSAFASGTFDQLNRFKTFSRGGCVHGSGEVWKAAIDRMMAGFIYPDGGGVTVNHPTWTSLDREFMLELLDYDPRVLGIEVIEGGGGNSERYWDFALSTGRQCFGFFVPDHSIRRKDGSFGVCVLVVPELSVRACLKAYRDGNFYGAKRGLDELRFTRIAFGGATVEAETDRPARFEVITAAGVVKTIERGTSVAWTMEKESGYCGPKKDFHVFARIKAYALDGSGEELFSQPYMLI